MTARRIVHLDSGIRAETASPDSSLLDVVELPTVTPSTPPAGVVRFYARTDGHAAFKDSTGTETDLG